MLNSFLVKHLQSQIIGGIWNLHCLHVHILSFFFSLILLCYIYLPPTFDILLAASKTSSPITSSFYVFMYSLQVSAVATHIDEYEMIFFSKLLFYFNHPLWFSSKSKINIHQQPSSFHIVSIYLYKIHPHILNISQPSSGLSSVLHSAQIQCFSLPTSCFCWWELRGFETHLKIHTSSHRCHTIKNGLSTCCYAVSVYLHHSCPSHILLISSDHQRCLSIRALKKQLVGCSSDCNAHLRGSLKESSVWVLDDSLHEWSCVLLSMGGQC